MGDKTEIVNDQSGDLRIEILMRSEDGIRTPEVSKVTVVRDHPDMIEGVGMMYLQRRRSLWLTLLSMEVCRGVRQTLVASLRTDSHRKIRWNMVQGRGNLQWRIFGGCLA